MSAGRSILVIGFGNPARGDDGLGPAFAQAVESAAIPGVRAMWDYQPNVEHAADILDADAVLFADASTDAPEPFSLLRLLPVARGSFSTHTLGPESVLALAHETLGWRGKAYLLALRGYSFDAFDEALSPVARANLQKAIDRLIASLADGQLEPLLADVSAHHSDRGGEPCQTARN